MYISNNVLSRIDEEGCAVSFDVGTYYDGILDVVDFLFAELTASLTEEGRYFGVVKSYMSEVKDIYSKINEKVTEDEVEVYGRILYLYKPVLREEYSRLVRKRLSPADANICIIRKILGILEENTEYANLQEVKSLRRVVNCMYDNIRNGSKEDPVFNLANIIRRFIQDGSIGKYRLDMFSYTDEYLNSGAATTVHGDEAESSNNLVFVKNLM